MAPQLPLFTTFNLLVQIHIPVPSFQPCTLNSPKCAPLFSQLQIFDNTDYKYRPEQFVNAIKARTIHQLGPEPTSLDRKRIWHVRRMALFTTSLDGPAFSWFNSLSKTDTQHWSTFTLKFHKQFDSVAAQQKLSAEAQIVQFNPHESIPIYACRVGDLVNKARLTVLLKRVTENMLIFSFKDSSSI